MVSKYIVLWVLPSSFVSELTIMSNAVEIQDMPKTVEPGKKEIELSIDYSDLKNRIKSEYQGASNDIDRYIKEQMDEQRDKAYYQISKEDGFLDWVFGYFIGYKMMWKKIKGFFGSDDNEIKMVSDKFQNDVIQPGLDNTLKNIQAYSRNRIEDYYKSVITATAEHLNTKTAELKKQGYTNMEVESKSIPWSKYIVSSSADSFVLLELTGVTSISVVTGKVVGSKVAALLGPKMLALISAKTASVVAGKIAASFSLMFAPLVDWAINETSKQIQYDSTKKDFEKMIDDILADTQKDIGHKVHNALMEEKNSIYKELNQKTKIKVLK
jgi:hypothetical protein